MKRTLRTVAVIAAMIVGVLIIYGMLDLFAARQIERDDRADLRIELKHQEQSTQRQEAATQVLADQVRGLGETPVVTPTALPPANVRYIPIPGPRGLLGPPGKVGNRGVAGTAGVAGLNGTAGLDGKDGAAGKDGAPGSDGKDGRSLTSMECTADGWVIGYSDGTTSTASGPCRAEPIPTP